MPWTPIRTATVGPWSRPIMTRTGQAVVLLNPMSLGRETLLLRFLNRVGERSQAPVPWEVEQKRTRESTPPAKWPRLKPWHLLSKSLRSPALHMEIPCREFLSTLRRLNRSTRGFENGSALQRPRCRDGTWMTALVFPSWFARVPARQALQNRGIVPRLFVSDGRMCGMGVYGRWKKKTLSMAN